MDSIYITGSTGSIGSNLVGSLETCNSTCDRIDLGQDPGWSEAFKGKHSVVHCAALNTSRGYSKESVFKVNVEGTKRIARIAKEVGVSRFLFLSSVKVFGEYSSEGEVFVDETSERRPGSVYGESKARAEDELMKLHEPGQFEVVIIRPTVVIADPSKGAIGTMARIAAKGYPFPVSRGENARDFVTIHNLVSAIKTALLHPASGGRAYSVTDGGAISTRALFAALAKVEQKKPRFLPIPNQSGLRLFQTVKKEALWHRVFGNLRVDHSRIRDSLGWHPAHGTLEFIGTEFGGNGDA
ncbi:MAG: NAD-dependent epimerase/dehydratase family protein [Verrucomicrobiales bacterium]|nr:NAD-dependent epimerase/dehydratase family protein [Verrucomicrobiales bacterium]